MEILIVLGIFGLLASSAVVAISTLRGGSDLQAEARGFQRVLELARSKTIASEGDTRYGVYATSTSPHRYILFQGNDYASGVTVETYNLRDTIEFESAIFVGLSTYEVVFDRIQGSTSNTGSAVLQMKADPSNTTAVYVESSGNVEIGSSIVPIGNPVTDSRHVHIDYIGRIINTATETLTFTFFSPPGPDVVQNITIADFLSGGQIVWEGTVTVGGEDQVLKVHTHTLNNGFDSQFSVHRDQRFNTKALTIELSGDSSFTLVEYAADGTVTRGTAAAAQEPDVQ